MASQMPYGTWPIKHMERRDILNAIGNVAPVEKHWLILL